MPGVRPTLYFDDLEFQRHDAVRSLGSILMAAGVGLGLAVGLAILAGITIPGLSWIVAVGLVKLTLLAAAGLIGVGATAHRLARRADERARIASAPPNEEL